MRKVQTVMGPIDPPELGFTLMHEHFLLTDPSMTAAFHDWIDRRAFIDQAVIDVKAVMAAGVKTIVDATPINLGRDVTLLREIAERTGLHIIVSTGFYYMEEPWFTSRLNPDRLADQLQKEVENGIQGTDIRAGVIKCATDIWGLTPANRKLLQAAARLHKRTGLPILTHAHAPSRNGLLQQEIFAEEGVDLSKVVIGHSDDINDIKYHQSIARNGSYIGMDRLGNRPTNSLKDRINTLTQLCSLGLANKIVLSHDFAVFSDFMSVGCHERTMTGQVAERSWRVIPEIVLPALETSGVTGQQIYSMIVTNPAQIFS